MTAVSEVMTRDVRTLSPQDSIARAAQAMAALDVGVVPVCEGDRLVGMVTDRDLVVRGVAKGRAVEDTPLREVMSPEPSWCYDDQSTDDVLEQMRAARIRRVPVLDRREHLVGMLTLGDVAVKADEQGAGIVLEEVSEPARPDPAAAESAPSTVAAEGGAVPPAGRLAAVDDGSVLRGDRPDDGRWANLGVEPRTDNRIVWVLVADEALARILQRAEVGHELEDVEALTDPTAHDKEGDLHRDAFGRRSGSATHGARQNTPHRIRGTASVTSSAGEDQQHLEAQTFARRVAQHLAEALQQKRFDELRIVAAPRFLGLLRKELDAHVSATVSEELSKDLIHADNAELTRRLFPEPAGGAPAA